MRSNTGTDLPPSGIDDRTVDGQVAADLAGTIGADLLVSVAQLVLETALERELVRHLGYDRYSPLGRNRLNSRNGARPKTVQTDLGPVRILVPRDRYGTFAPVMVRKRQQRRVGLCRLVMGLLTGEQQDEIARRLTVVYHGAVGRELVVDVTKALLGELVSLPRISVGGGPVVSLQIGTTQLASGRGQLVTVHAVVGRRADGGLELLALQRGEAHRDSRFWPGLLGALAARHPMQPQLVASEERRIRVAAATTWPGAAVVSRTATH